MSRLLTGLLAAALLFVGWSRITALEPKREEGSLPTQPELPYFRYLPDAEPRGRVLVLPGLNSNKEFTQVCCVLQSADRIEDVARVAAPGLAPFSSAAAPRGKHLEPSHDAENARRYVAAASRANRSRYWHTQMFRNSHYRLEVCIALSAHAVLLV